MTQRTALVTGASRGIGRAIADRLASRGYRVVGASRTAPTGAVAWSFRELDLADPVATRAALAAIVAETPVDVLVNNAGIARMATLEGTTPEIVQEMAAVNVAGPALCAQAVVAGMRGRGWGRIVNIGSRAALGKEGRGPYGASKGGVASLTRTWALELAAAGITVNCVAPGPIDTEMFREGQPPGDPRRIAIERAIPLGRLGTPDDIAAAVGYLVSEDAGFVTGQTLYVCGGLTIGAVS